MKPTYLKARPCQCDEPAADPRDHSCIYCGHQVAGIPLPGRPKAFPSLADDGKPATKRRQYRMAA